MVQAQTQSGSTTTMIGDTLLVECRPVTVAAKPRPVAHKPRSHVRKARVVAKKPTTLAVAPKIAASPKKPVRRVVRAKRKIRKAPVVETKQICREIPLPGQPKSRSPIVPAWAAALGPVNGPPVSLALDVVPLDNGEAGGILPPEPFLGSVHGPVMGAGGIMKGGAVAAIPLIFIAFLNDHDHHNPDITPEFPVPPVLPPVLPPASTVPEPSSLVLLGTGLAGLGQVLRRRKR